MIERNQHIDAFYEVLNQLAQKIGGAQRLADCHGRIGIPARGVYFFFEPGEYRANGNQLRIVRIGTHAVSLGSKTTLWNRLYAHRGSQTGGGNHRGSVFRLHVGKAIINREGFTDFPHWGQGSSASKVIRQSEDALERRVSAYLGNLRLLWLKVDDEPSKESQRAFIERNAIALLAGANGLSPVDTPSTDWLGHCSDHEKIRLSGLWNLDHIGSSNKPASYDPAFLTLMRHHVNSM